MTEIIDAVKAHTKACHDLDVTDEQVKAKIKPVAMPAMGKEAKKD